MAGTLTVNTVVLTVTADNQTKTQGAANPALTVSYAGFVNGDSAASLTTQPTASTTATTGSPAGTYPITVSGGVSSNYSFNYVAGTLTVNAKLAQTITFGALSAKTYGAADFAPGATASSGLTVTYASSNPAVATIVGGNIHIVGAGTTNITASQAGDATYNPATDVVQSLTVNKAPLTATANSTSKIYGTVNPVFTVSYSGFVNSDTAASLTTQPTVASTAVTGSPVGSYPITAQNGASSNYSISYVSGTLTINPAVLTITAANATKPQGTVNPPLSFSYSGFVAGDTILSLTTQPSASTTALTSSPIGDYPITVSGGVSSNYTFAYVAGTLTVFTPSTYNLSVAMNGTGGGSVNSTPAGIACSSGSSIGCTAPFNSGTPVTLLATADSKSEFGGWGGVCTGTGSCDVTINAITSVTATFNAMPLVRLPGPIYYATIQEAYDNSSNGDSIAIRDQTFSENLVLGRSINVLLDCGKDATWNTTGYTTVNGSLTVVNGGVTINNLLIQ